MDSDNYEGALQGDPDPQPKGEYTLDEVVNLGQANPNLAGPLDLVRPCDIKGILHSHSRWTDGAHSLGSMVDTARQIGARLPATEAYYELFTQAKAARAPPAE